MSACAVDKMLTRGGLAGKEKHHEVQGSLAPQAISLCVETLQDTQNPLIEALIETIVVRVTERVTDALREELAAPRKPGPYIKVPDAAEYLPPVLESSRAF